VALLYVEIDPHEVDVNVHPAKAEVRFSKPSAVFGFIVSAVRQALNPVMEAAAGPQSLAEPAALPPLYRDHQPSYGRLREPAPAYGYTKASPLPPAPAQAPLFESRTAGYASLRLIGSFGRSYLLLEGDQALYILDQHAAHERINFERLKRRETTLKPQQLLSPLLIELGPAEIAAGIELAPCLNELGFELEEFGPTTLALRSLPAGLSADQARSALTGLIHEFMEGEIRKNRLTDDLLASLACHMSVKAGHDLTETEQLNLIKDLEACGAPQTCPHGRPLYRRISIEEIERWLSRRN
jgi:DNA mismatch repair protein MutL